MWSSSFYLLVIPVLLPSDSSSCSILTFWCSRICSSWPHQMQWLTLSALTTRLQFRGRSSLLPAFGVVAFSNLNSQRKGNRSVIADDEEWSKSNKTFQWSLAYCEWAGVKLAVNENTTLLPVRDVVAAYAAKGFTASSHLIDARNYATFQSRERYYISAAPSAWSPAHSVRQEAFPTALQQPSCPFVFLLENRQRG